MKISALSNKIKLVSLLVTMCICIACFSSCAASGTLLSKNEAEKLDDLNDKSNATDDADLLNNAIEYYNGLPVYPIFTNWAINPSDYKEVVGDADYVFVGKANDNLGETYIDSMPFTNYSIEVSENIKGNLISTISLAKLGGLSQTQDYYMIPVNDFLPEKDETYIFVAYAQADGSLIVSYPTIEYSEAELEKFASAAETPKTTLREHNLSTYDSSKNDA